MKILGMIGGTSWHSTIEYYRLINELVNEKLGSDVNPYLILYSVNIQLMKKGSLDEIKESFLDKSQRLKTAGAEAVMFCANTPHLAYAYVSTRLDIPVLHIADATGREALRRGLRKLGLLGTLPVMKRGFIKDHLSDKFGLDIITPQEEEMERVHHYIANELTAGLFREETRDYFLTQMNLLKTKGAEGIILGCTELPLLVKEEDYDLPLFDTTYLHAQDAVHFIMEGSI